MSPRETAHWRETAQLDLLREAFRRDPAWFYPQGYTWSELRKAIDSVVAKRRSRVLLEHPDLGNPKRESLLRTLTGKAPTTGQLSVLLQLLAFGDEIRIEPKRGPGTPETRYILRRSEDDFKRFIDWLRPKVVRSSGAVRRGRPPRVLAMYLEPERRRPLSAEELEHFRTLQ